MPKLLKQNANGTKEEYAGLATSAGAGSAAEFIIADSSGRMDVSFLPVGVGADTFTATTGEALSAGDFVYINGSGNVLKADADVIGKAAVGYVLSSYGSGVTATVYADDVNTSVTGLTPGTKYFLSQTAGLITATAPTTPAGAISQGLGTAITTTSLRVKIEEPIIRA